MIDPDLIPVPCPVCHVPHASIFCAPLTSRPESRITANATAAAAANANADAFASAHVQREKE